MSVQNEEIERFEEHYEQILKFARDAKNKSTYNINFVLAVADLIYNYRDSEIVARFRRENSDIDEFSRCVLKRKDRKAIFEGNVNQIRLMVNLLLKNFFL